MFVKIFTTYKVKNLLACFSITALLLFENKYQKHFLNCVKIRLYVKNRLK